MQIGDPSTNAEMASATPTFQATLFPMPQSHPLPIRELLATDQPRNRLLAHGAAALYRSQRALMHQGALRDHNHGATEGALRLGRRALIAVGLGSAGSARNVQPHCACYADAP